ncbi:MAG: homocysteine S-methyltransferase family protein [Hyphomicrobiaceae bacterium]
MNANYRTGLPQLNGYDVTTTGGMETWLQFVDGFELQHFCFFDLLNNPKAVEALTDYHRKVIEAVLPYGFGVLIEGLHYRASRDWGELIGYSQESLKEINIRGIELYRELADEYETNDNPMPVGGVIGPRGDAYRIGRTPNASEAEEYHAEQIETLKLAGADLISAITFSSVPEAIGVARAAKSYDMPVVISFLAKNAGRLESGETMREAIEQVDAATNSAPAYYMINCCHPTEFAPAFEEQGWTRRLGGFMPNAVAMEKLSLCKLGHLEDGDPNQLGVQMAELAIRFPHISVWGGCCGTDSRHLGQIARRVKEVRQRLNQ